MTHHSNVGFYNTILKRSIRLGPHTVHNGIASKRQLKDNDVVHLNLSSTNFDDTYQYSHSVHVSDDSDLELMNFLCLSIEGKKYLKKNGQSWRQLNIEFIYSVKGN